MIGRRFSTAKKKNRGRASGLTLPPTEILRNKANEMAALQGQMQYQAGANSTCAGMSPGLYSQFDLVTGLQRQGGNTSILPSFLQNAHSQLHSYQQQVPTYAMVQGPAPPNRMVQARPMSSIDPMMAMPPVQQVQIPTSIAASTASTIAAAATGLHGYSPTTASNYGSNCGATLMRMDDSSASYSYMSSPPPPFAGRNPQGGLMAVHHEQCLGDGLGGFDDIATFAGEADLYSHTEYGHDFEMGDDFDIDPKDAAIPAVVETRQPLPMQPLPVAEGTNAAVANPYVGPSVGTRYVEGGYVDHIEGAAGNSYHQNPADASADEAAATQQFGECFF